MTRALLEAVSLPPPAVRHSHACSEQSRGTADPLDRIVERVSAVCPRPADPLEVAAVLESIGYTDAVIRGETGEPDSRALGAVLFDLIRSTAAPERTAPSPKKDDGLRVLLQTFSLSSVYALPWIVTFVVEWWRPQLLRVPQEAAGPISLALMLSLIVSGGFVQCIARKGTFYTGLGQAAIGRAVSVRIWKAGLLTLAAVAAASFIASWYFELFEPGYAALGVLTFFALGTLWLTCGVLWLERRYWYVPAAFGGAAAAFAAAKHEGVSAFASQGVGIGVALAIALTLMALAMRRDRRAWPMRLPRFPVLARALAPYFCYGAGYFAFVFADRMAAGTAAPTAAGVQFSVDARYQAGMDAALLCFLVSMFAVEFLNYRFVHFWQRESQRWRPTDGQSYRGRVRARCARSRAIVAATFGSIAVLLSLIPGARETLRDPAATLVLGFGLVGYLLLELALFNALVMFSISAPVPVLRALVAGLTVDVAGGYVLSNVFGPLWAAVAMAAGAAVFLWRSDRELSVAIGRPGYGCYVA